MRRLAHRLRHPHTTVRWRLTLLYGGLFLVCGAGLLAITYTLVAHATIVGPRAVFARADFPPKPGFKLTITRGPHSAAVVGPTNRPVSKLASRQAGLPPFVSPRIQRLLRSSAGRQAFNFVGNQQRVADLHQLEVESAIALAIMALISGLLGWLVAGRVLRPLRTITATAQEISEANLHRRLEMPGPRDELRQLADTIDGLLGSARERVRGPATVRGQRLTRVAHPPDRGAGAARDGAERSLGHRPDVPQDMSRGPRGVRAAGEADRGAPDPGARPAWHRISRCGGTSRRDEARRSPARAGSRRPRPDDRGFARTGHPDGRGAADRKAGFQSASERAAPQRCLGLGQAERGQRVQPGGAAGGQHRAERASRSSVSATSALPAAGPRPGRPSRWSRAGPLDSGRHSRGPWSHDGYSTSAGGRTRNRSSVPRGGVSSRPAGGS